MPHHGRDFPESKSWEIRAGGCEGFGEERVKGRRCGEFLKRTRREGRDAESWNQRLPETETENKESWRCYRWEMGCS